MTPPLIFLPDVQRLYREDAAAIHGVMARYYQGVEEARVELLDNVFHPEWLMKDTDTPGAATLNVEGKAAFIKRVRGHGPYPAYAAGRRIVTISTAHDRMACVRVDKIESRSSTVFVLFKIEGSWTIMDKIWVNPRPAAVFLPVAPVLASVSSHLDEYFAARAAADRGTLTTLLHERWEEKRIENGGLVAHDRELILGERIEPLASADPSSLVSIDLLQGTMAVIRVDLPASEETRFLVLLRLGDVWRFVLERRSRKRH